MKKIGVMGSGLVGETLANGFLKHGYEVMRASREPKKLAAWKEGAGAKARVGTFAEAAAWGDAVVLAVKGSAALSAVEQAGAQNLAGKLVMDTTNPIADAPPEKGVLRYTSEINHSLMERLQEAAPEARFVKVFSCVGNAFMVNPSFPGGPPTMFICGDDSGAKADLRTVLDQFGWETADMGGVEAARAIEPLCILWCLPGLRENRWTHAFKLLQLK